MDPLTEARNLHRESSPEARAVLKPTIRILSLLVGDKEGQYRIQTDDTVRYLTIDTGIWDEQTMCWPVRLIPLLRPHLPEGHWTKMHISEGDGGSLKTITSVDPLPAVTFAWHSVKVDVLKLQIVQKLKFGVLEVIYDGRPAIAKIACFPHQIRQAQNESWAYSWVTDLRPGEDPVSPAVLAQLTENGRIIGILLEKLEGNYASSADLPQCEELVRRIHKMGLTHGDVNKFNFVIDRSSNSIRMIDFEHAEEFTEDAARAELESLPAELAEETWRGAIAMHLVDYEHRHGEHVKTPQL